MWGRNGEPRSNRRTAEGRTHLYAWPSPREGKGLGCLALRYPAHAWGAATQPPLCLSRASSAPHVWRGEGWRRGVGGRTPKLRAYTAGPSAFWSALVASPSSPSSRNLGLGLRCRGRLASAGLASACAAHPPARIRQRERERERELRGAVRELGAVGTLRGELRGAVRELGAMGTLRGELRGAVRELGAVGTLRGEAELCGERGGTLQQRTAEWRVLYGACS